MNVVENIAVKVCNKCGKEKSPNEFYKDNSSKDKLSRWCKVCYKEHSQKYYYKKSEKLKQYSRQYYLENKEKCNQNARKYYFKNIEKFKEKGKRFHLKNLEYFKQHSKHYRLKNPEKVKQYKINNRKKLNQYEQHRRKTDINYKIIINCRARINCAIRNNSKSGHTIELIMCSIPELKLHIEKQFLTGMAWNNYGYGNDKWNIDHIIPCSFFNMSDPVEQYMCFRWQNLQPLWQTDNQVKSDKISQ
jgi:hypothetical protein